MRLRSNPTGSLYFRSPRYESPGLKGILSYWERLVYTFGHAGGIFSLPYCSSLKLHSFNRFRYHLAGLKSFGITLSIFVFFFSICYKLLHIVTDGGLSHLGIVEKITEMSD